MGKFLSWLKSEQPEIKTEFVSLDPKIAKIMRQLDRNILTLFEIRSLIFQLNFPQDLAQNQKKSPSKTPKTQTDFECNLSETSDKLGEISSAIDGVISDTKQIILELQSSL